MRILLLLCLFWLHTNAAAQERILFDGTDVDITYQHWSELNTDTLPSLEELASNLDRFEWVPLHQKEHSKIYSSNYIRAKVRVSYRGEDRPALYIPNSFIPDTQVGVIYQGKLLLWKTLNAPRELANGRAAHAYGLTLLPLDQPGEYDLLLKGSTVGHSAILRSTKLLLEEDFLYHQLPLRTSVTSAILGGTATFWLLCGALLLYRRLPRYVYAQICLTGAAGTILIRERTLAALLPADSTWLSILVLPLMLAFVYGGLLLFTAEYTKRSAHQKARRLLIFCGWLTLIPGFINAGFPIREHVAVGIVSLLASQIGLILATVLCFQVAYNESLKEKFFALAVTALTVVTSMRTIASVTGKNADNTLLILYLCLEIISAYFFIDYLLWITQMYVKDKTEQAANITRFDLVSRFSHELRTPLNAVIGLTDLLRESKDTAAVKSYANMIQTAGHSLLSLVNDILDFSKLDSSHILLAHDSFRIDEVLNSILTTSLPRSMESRISIRICMAPTVPFFLQGDALRLTQILTNLTSNALKFSQPDDIIDIKVEPVHTEGNRVELLFSVIDCGRGIPADKIDGIFEPFSQVAAADGTKLHGTGLGLPICKLLIEQMGGHIHVVSTPLKGTTFTFNLCFDQDPNSPHLSDYLSLLKNKEILIISQKLSMYRPFQDFITFWGANVDSIHHLTQVSDNKQYDLIIAETFTSEILGLADWLNKQPHDTAINLVDIKTSAIQEQITHPNLRVRTGPSPLLNSLIHFIHHITGQTLELQGLEDTYQLESLNNHHVLLVDDNKVNLMIAGKLLASLGVTYDSAQGGMEALEKLYSNNNHYSLVLLDCEMPDIDGFEVTRSWRRFEEKNHSPRLPIVALTAHALTEVKEECIAAGMDDVIYKPIGRSALANLLQKHTQNIVKTENRA